MTEREWIELSKAALTVAIKTIRDEAAKQNNNQELHNAADYCESIKDQCPHLK